MKIKPKWLRDLASLVFTVYYLIAAERADDKVRRVRATLTVEHLRVAWNKATTPYLWAMAKLVRPRLTRYSPRAIRIPRPAQSVHTEPVNAWLYFDGPLSALRDQTCLVLDVPGGGFVAMSPRNSEDKLLAWAGQLKVPILSIDYKKAPEYAYPYALHECYDVYHAIVRSSGRCMGLSGEIRPRVVVTGESAGGNLAVGMVLMALQSAMAQGWQGDDVLPRPDGVVLAYPALNMQVASWMTDEQMSLIQDKGSSNTNRSVLERKRDQYRKLTPFTSPGHSVEALTELSPSNGEQKDKQNDVPSEVAKSLEERIKKSDILAANKTDEVQPLRTRLAVSSMISYVHDRILTPEMMRAMIILYIGPHHRPDFSTDFWLSPVLAPDALLARFPKTYILTGERDPLVDDTVIFAGRLRQAKLGQFRERHDMGLEKSQRQFHEKDHVEVSLIPGVSHGFMQMAGFFPEGWKYINRSAKWIEDLFDAACKRSPQSSLLQSTNRSAMNGSGRSPNWTTHTPNSIYQRRNHYRSLTGESSGDEDRPLEMSIGKLTPMTQPENTEDSRPRHKKSRYQLPGRLTTMNDKQTTNKHSHLTHRVDYFSADETNSAPESPVATRPRGRSISSLGSEEDILDRRMNGLAGGLMGLGERAQTPGP
ncbi:hypothetical protein N7510_009595 [Penicillium lagena]|uniref:uncharacterized protein n=1 Tax=Penicillium lagena TaxID=94218 RepID=UPI00253FEFFB|nr:uncharacterized protein N7510_009595 [Penicillium lagena]KAJ5604441.1 hypothetical protein N7510_009595 [Penicillium lagena]